MLVSTKIRPQYETSATVPELQLHVTISQLLRTLEIAANALIILTD